MNDIYKIRLEMKKLGWESEDKLSPTGWSDGYGYSIWFKRYDWHGKNAASITGHDVCFHEHEKDGSEYDKVLATVIACAEKAKKAWLDFPDSIPHQYANGIRQATMFVPFAEGSTKIMYNETTTIDLSEERKGE